MKNLRVAILIPSLSHGGAERVASVLATEWSRFSNVKIYMINFTELPQFYALPTSVTQINFSLPKNPSLAQIIGVAFKIRRYLGEESISSVLSFMDRYNLFMLWLTWGLSINRVISDRSSPAKRSSRQMRLLKWLFYRRADAIVAQTKTAAAALRKFVGPAKIVVIANPVAESLVSEAPRQRLILSVGRLVPEKGHFFLLQAFVKDPPHGWQLAIVGEGPLKESLREQSRQYGVESQVRFVGAVKDIGEWYAQASIFVLPSLYEGFPNALVEAMAASLPCIAFDCVAGPSDIIEHGTNGYLVPVGDVEVLAETLQHAMRMSEEEREAIGSAAKERARDFDASSISRQYLDVCTSARMNSL